MIYYSTPWRSDKNIGRANNEFMSLVPDGAWVCIADGDAMWLRPDWGRCVEQVVEANPTFALIGCMTNRQGWTDQLYDGNFDDVCNAFKCHAKANEAWNNYGTKVDDTQRISGLCMIFRKDIWEKVGGFKEHTRHADAEFSKSMKSKGLKIGIARGLYMMHGYRLWEPDQSRARSSYRHLT